MTPFIVAEISKNWRDGKMVVNTPVIAVQFEMVIEHNRRKGYRLYSWQLHQFMLTPNEMVETIIAVFEQDVIVTVVNVGVVGDQDA